MNAIQKLFGSVRKFWQGGWGDNIMNWWNSGISRRTRYELLLEYKNIVYACITAIADDYAKYTPIICKRDAKGNSDIITTHPFLDLLESPNPTMSQFELFEATISYRKLTGEAFWYLVRDGKGLPRQIYIMRPDRIKIAIDDASGDVKGYTFTKDDGKEMPLEVDEVIHFKNFNPFNPYRGLGTVESILLYIDTENITSSFQNNFIRNSASPSGILSVNGKIGREAWLKLKKQWKEQHAGAKNAGKTMIIREADAKFEKIGLSLSDLSMKELKAINKEDVLEGFRVPEAILGKTDSSGLGRANIETIEYIFAKRTIDPEQERTDDILTRVLKYYYKDNSLYVNHESQVPEDKEMKLKEHQAGYHKWLTANDILKETRREESTEPLANELFYQFNEIPINEAIPQAPVTESKSIKVKVKVLDLKKKTGQAAFFQQLDKIEQKENTEYQKGINKLLDKQEKLVLDLLPKIMKSKKQLVEGDEDALTIEFTENEIKTDLLKSLLLSIQQAGETGVEFVGTPDVVFVLDQSIRKAVFTSTERLLQTFNKETALKLQKQLALGLQNKESIEELTARVESIYEEATGFRAERIARSEAHHFINEGVEESYRQSGVTQKQWVTDSNPCPLCEGMNGTIVDIGTPFLSLGDTVTGTDGSEYAVNYIDVEYADLHPNCNCKLLPVYS